MIPAIVAWTVLGLIAGALGKLLMPGDDPDGCLVTILIGVAGAIIGGFLASILPFLPQASPVGWLPGLGSIFTSTIGAVVLLFIYRKVRK